MTHTVRTGRGYASLTGPVVDELLRIHLIELERTFTDLEGIEHHYYRPFGG